MRIVGKPLLFEDRTGQIGSTDFDDIYDRMFYRVLQQGFQSTGQGVPDRHICFIYDRGRRSRRISSYHNETLQPSAILEFFVKFNRQTGEITSLQLGSITVEKMPPVPMKHFLRKTGTWGRLVISSVLSHPRSRHPSFLHISRLRDASRHFPHHVPIPSPQT
jgi:hypothetical protein